MTKDTTELVVRTQRSKSRRNVSPPTGERNVRQLPEGTVRPSCPHCGATRNSVTDSRAAPLGEDVTMRRVRECNSCKARWTTYEMGVDQFEREIKNRGNVRDGMLWGVPEEYELYTINAGNPGIHGFLPLPKKEKKD